MKYSLISRLQKNEKLSVRFLLVGRMFKTLDRVVCRDQRAQNFVLSIRIASTAFLNHEQLDIIIEMRDQFAFVEAKAVDICFSVTNLIIVLKRCAQNSRVGKLRNPLARNRSIGFGGHGGGLDSLGRDGGRGGGGDHGDGGGWRVRVFCYE